MLNSSICGDENSTEIVMLDGCVFVQLYVVIFKPLNKLLDSRVFHFLTKLPCKDRQAGKAK